MTTKHDVVGVVPVKFKVWKQIKIGTGLKTADDFRRDLKANDCQISDWASDLLDKPEFNVSEVAEEIELGNASVAELGFTQATRYDAICVRIVELGYELCEPEDGPQLRKQYKDQPLHEWLRVAMKAIRDSDGDLSIFSVGHGEGGLCLGSDHGRPDVLFGLGDRFVFRLRKRPMVA